MLTYFWVDLVIICAMSLVLSSVLIWGFGWRHPSSSFERDEFLQSGLFIFLILFFSMWAGGPWLPAWGPLVYGRPLSGPFIIGLFLVLLLLATMHPKRRKPVAQKANSIPPSRTYKSPSTLSAPVMPSKTHGSLFMKSILISGTGM